MIHTTITERQGLKYLAQFMNMTGYTDISKIGLKFWDDKENLNNGAITIFRNNSKIYQLLSQEDKNMQITGNTVLGVTLIDSNGNIEILYRKVKKGLSNLFITEIELDLVYKFTFNTEWNLKNARIFSTDFHNPKRITENFYLNHLEAFVYGTLDEIHSVDINNELSNISYLGTMVSAHDLNKTFELIRKIGFEIELCPYYQHTLYYELIKDSTDQNIYHQEANLLNTLITNGLIHTYTDAGEEGDINSDCFIKRITISSPEFNEFMD